MRAGQRAEGPRPELGHFNPNGPHFEVESALNGPIKCLVIDPVIGKEVSKYSNVSNELNIFFKNKAS